MGKGGAPESYILTAHSLRGYPAEDHEGEKWPEVCRTLRTNPSAPLLLSLIVVQADF
jgi:hypothetical protein